MDSVATLRLHFNPAEFSPDRVTWQVDYTPSGRHLLCDDLKAALRKRSQELGVGYQTAAKMIFAKYVNAKLLAAPCALVVDDPG